MNRKACLLLSRTRADDSPALLWEAVGVDRSSDPLEFSPTKAIVTSALDTFVSMQHSSPHWVLIPNVWVILGS